METKSTISTDSTNLSAWKYLFNFKVALSACAVWIGLICQDFYVCVLNFSWILDWTPTENKSYIYWILTLFFIYFLFCLINYLVKLPALQRLYHKKVANITLIIWLIMNISCYQLLYFNYFIGYSALCIYKLKVIHLFALYSC